MAKWWTERLNPEKHKDHMATTMAGGASTPLPHPPGFAAYPVYFVRVCGFTFEFHRVADIRMCLEHFSRKVHPSSRLHTSQLNPHERYWHPWHERLPLRLFEESRRLRVVKALERALAEFEEG